MKRDMDLIRSILLFSEENCSGLNSKAVEATDFTETENEEHLFAHIKMLEAQGLLNEGYHTMSGAEVGNLTWRGHDFLDTVRDPEIWQKTKEVGEKAGGWTLDILSNIAKGLITTQIKKLTGVEI